MHQPPSPRASITSRESRVGSDPRTASRLGRTVGIGVAVLVVGSIALVAGSLGSGSLAASAAVPQVAAPRALLTSGEPFAIAFDAQSGRAYVTDTKENTLFILDAATGTPIAFVPTGRQPNHVVLAGGRAFVSNFADASITVVDMATAHAVKTFAIGGLGLAFNPTTHRLYAAGGTKLYVLDTATDSLVATIAAPPGASLWGVAVDAATDRIYVTDIAHPLLLVYDGARNALVGQVAIDAPGRFGIAVGAAGRVYVASYTDQNPQLSVIDGPKATVVRRAPIDSFTASLAVDPVTGLVHASSAVARTVTAIDPVAGRALSRSSLSKTPGGLAVTPGGELLVVTSGGTAPPARLFIDPVPVVRP